MHATYISFPELGKVSVETEDFDTSKLDSREAVIRSETSIISAGTELARLHGLDNNLEYPVRPGYGCIGIIEELGSEIDDFNVGDRVFYAGQHASAQRFTHGLEHQWSHMFAVPDGVDPIDAVVGCMAQIAFTGPHLTELKLGDTVVVYGLGTVGNLAAQMYKLRGARVIGVDPASKRCEVARACGIAECIDVAPADQHEAIMALTNGEGADVTVDAVGHSAIVNNAVQACKTFGQVILLGTPRAPVEGNLTEAFHTIHSNLLSVRGAHMWTMPLNKQRGVAKDVEWAFATIFEQIRSGALQVRPLISHIIKPDEVPAAYKGLKETPNEYTGAVIDWR